MTVPSGPQEFDVYCSFAPPEAEAARALVETMINKGLRVAWRDSLPEDLSAALDGILDEVGRSRVFVSLCTPSYARHAACQLEWCAAVLSGRRETEAADQTRT